MRVALCISGSIRNFKDTFFSFKEFILDNFNVDTFIYSPENKQGKEQNLKDVHDLYNPIQAVITSTDFYKTLPCKYDVPNIYYMSYNTYMCNKLKKDYENKNNLIYDLVIRARPDYFWFRTFSPDELELAKNNILIPKEWAFKIHDNCARCDMLAIGNSELMDVYSALYENIDKYATSIAIHPETLCGYNLKVNNIPNIEIDRPVVFEYPSLRTEKYIHPYKFIKYFNEPNILDEQQFLHAVTNKRKEF